MTPNDLFADIVRLNAAFHTMEAQFDKFRDVFSATAKRYENLGVQPESETGFGFRFLGKMYRIDREFIPSAMRLKIVINRVRTSAKDGCIELTSIHELFIDNLGNIFTSADERQSISTINTPDDFTRPLLEILRKVTDHLGSEKS